MKTIIRIILFIAFVSIASAYSMQDFNLKVDSYFQEETLTENEDKGKEREWRIVVGTSFYTSHLKTEDLFEQSNLKQYGVEWKNYTISYSGFINSYNNKSHMIMLDHKWFFKESNFYFKAGAGIVKGYEKKVKYVYDSYEYEENGKTYIYEYFIENKNKFVFYKDYGILGTVGVGYRAFNIIDVEINVFGEAIIIGARVRM